MSEPEQSQRMSRRHFLKLGGMASAGLVGKAIAPEIKPIVEQNLSYEKEKAHAEEVMEQIYDVENAIADNRAGQVGHQFSLAKNPSRTVLMGEFSLKHLAEFGQPNVAQSELSGAGVETMSESDQQAFNEKLSKYPFIIANDNSNIDFDLLTNMRSKLKTETARQIAHDIASLTPATMLAYAETTKKDTEGMNRRDFLKFMAISSGAAFGYAYAGEVGADALIDTRSFKPELNFDTTNLEPFQQELLEVYTPANELITNSRDRCMHLNSLAEGALALNQSADAVQHSVAPAHSEVFSMYGKDTQEIVDEEESFIKNTVSKIIAKVDAKDEMTEWDKMDAATALVFMYGNHVPAVIRRNVNVTEKSIAQLRLESKDRDFFSPSSFQVWCHTMNEVYQTEMSDIAREVLDTSLSINMGLWEYDLYRAQNETDDSFEIDYAGDPDNVDQVYEFGGDKFGKYRYSFSKGLCAKIEKL